MSQDKVHADPVWNNRADFIIGASHNEPGTTEQLWARRLATDGHTFELCCIPFFAYGLALGDLVETNNEFAITRVVRASGRRVWRAWFDKPGPKADQLRAELVEVGALVEMDSARLWAIDAEDAERAGAVGGCLGRWEALGTIVVEDGG